MTIESRRVIPGDHPSLPHHFPGDPIVPGVVIINEVARVIGENRPGCWISGISRVKFTAPLRPGQPFTVSLNCPDAGTALFECRSDGDAQARGNSLLARGRLLLSGGEGGT